MILIVSFYGDRFATVMLKFVSIESRTERVAIVRMFPNIIDFEPTKLTKRGPHDIRLNIDSSNANNPTESRSILCSELLPQILLGGESRSD